ncbi:MAG: SMC-Scp complex subunit ScpB [Parcubacteria group bacterium]|nr:SMC-Scp complex subunit ScpB [Parcubacteria group bacterium]
MNDSLDTTLEALLFAAGEPITLDRLAKLSGASAADVRAALDVLNARLTHGVTLIRSETTAALAVPALLEEKVRPLVGDPEEREIGQAGLEILSILLYQGPATRSQIDYIRGVNSNSSMRTLLLRGLIERTKGESREGVYQPTIDLLTHLGISSADALPEAAELRAAIKEFLERRDAEHAKESAAEQQTV